MASPKVACHLIVYQRRDHTDLRGALSEVRDNGFDGIERGMLEGGDARMMKQALDEFGLVQWSLSSGYRTVDQVNRAIDYVQTLGGKFIMSSGDRNWNDEGLRAYEHAAEVYNDVGRSCKDAGITFCYHNHSWELALFDRSTAQAVAAELAETDPQKSRYVTGLERLYELTDPVAVKACVDVFWVQHGGRDPAAFLRHYSDRVGYVHLKDLRYVGPEPRRIGVLERNEAEFVELGRGEVDFPAIWEVLRPLDLPWVVYEQDRSTIPPAEAAGISRQYLRESLGI